MKKKKRFKELYGLTDKEIDIIVGDKALSQYYEALAAYGTNPKTGANWLLGNLLKLLNEKELETDQIPVHPEALYKLTEIIADFAAGKTQAAGFLMGQIMKTSKGKANPQVAKVLLEERLKQRG